MLVATDTLNSPLMRTISKALDADPAAGLELVRLSLYEALCDLAVKYGPELHTDIAKAAESGRAQLVRQYISKRLAGEDVTGVLDSAVAIGRISKDEDAETRHNASAKQPRDHGRFSGASVAGKVDIIGTHTKGVLDALGGKDQQDLSGKRGYDQLRATGRALTYVSALSGNQAGLAAGAVAQLVGEIGPQAENVLGPSVKRTAYRYRGTEKKPGERIQESAHRLGVIAQKMGDGTALTPAEQAVVAKWQADVQSPARRPDGQAPLPQDPAAAVFASVMASAQGKSGDELRLEATSQYLAGSLQGRIPSLHHAKISLEAGKMPPSIGYLVDSDGDVVSEAQGYNGDHYLPFDLKNLGALHGGSYVRTRTTGGPTDEDIYTGLMMGARQVTVVSHSGVFTVAFDKDVRGGRRYSDKARQMVDRYAALLEQINSGDHMEVPFSQADMTEMRERAVANAPRNADQQRSLLKQYMGEKRDALTFADDDELRTMAVQNVSDEYRRGSMAGVSRQVAERDTEDEYHDLRTKRDDAQARAYRLDGVGYEAALVALQQEFPFYLQTPQYETWRDFTSTRKLRPQAVRGKVGQLGGARTADVGYTRQRELVPTKIAGKARQQAAPKAEEPAAAAATTEPTAEQAAAAPPSTAGPSEAEIRASGVAENLAASAGEATLLVRQLGSEADEPHQGADDAVALNDNSNTAYLSYVLNTYHNPRGISQWLLAPTTDPRHIDRMQAALKALAPKISTEHYPPEFWHQANQSLNEVKMLKAPYAKATGPDPVLDAGDAPQAFAGMPKDYTSFTPYLNYLSANPGVMQYAADFLDMNDDAVAASINTDITHYERMRGLGETIKGNGGTLEGLAIDSNLSPDDAGDAVDMAEQGQQHYSYQEIADKQKAWSIVRGMQIVQALTSAQMPEITSDAAPKAPAQHQDSPAPQANPFAKPPASGAVGKRSRLVVHPLGSPVSVKLAKRMAPRSPAQALLLPTRDPVT